MKGMTIKDYINFPPYSYPIHNALRKSMISLI